MSPLSGKLENFILVKGRGRGSTELNAFDNALISAGVGNYNLVKISSILPPKAMKKDEIQLREGDLLPCAFSYMISKDPGVCIVSAVCVAKPKDEDGVGVIMEYSGYGTEEEALEIVKNMAKEAIKMRGKELGMVEAVAISSYSDGKEYVATFAGVCLW